MRLKVAKGGRHFSIDTSPYYSYGRRISLRKRTPAGDSGWRGESGSCGRGLISGAPGRLRAVRPSGTMTGPRGNPLHCGRPGAGNARSYLVPSQEARSWS
jgi:hypothetical protein